MSRLAEYFPAPNGLPVGPPAPPAIPIPDARPLGDLVNHNEEDPDELLKHRFLCRGGGLLLVGPTGVGKSSFAMQCMVQWALGQPAFDILPARPLKSLLIQAENDEGDLAEMRDGVQTGLGLDAGQRRQVSANVLVVRVDTHSGSLFFTQVVRPMLEKHRPDLLWIDPVLAYLGGDTASQRDVGEFLRNRLNPELHEFRCGAVLVHHTNKPPSGQEKPNWAAGELAYLGSGSAEWANWARAVVAIRAMGSHSVFELVAAKRGRRLNWRFPDGISPTCQKFIVHALETGGIFWREAAEAEIDAAANTRGKAGKGTADLMALVPQDRPVAKSELLSQCAEHGIGRNRARDLISALVESGRHLFEWVRPRAGKKPVPYLARRQQPVNDRQEPIFPEILTVTRARDNACEHAVE